MNAEAFKVVIRIFRYTLRQYNSINIYGTVKCEQTLRAGWCVENNQAQGLRTPRRGLSSDVENRVSRLLGGETVGLWGGNDRRAMVSSTL